MCGKKCPAGKACKDGKCDGECSPACAMGEACCDGKCINPLNDADNCSMCGKKCLPPFPGIPPVCLFGICVDFTADMGAPADMK
jgi:hypothetical protein